MTDTERTIAALREALMVQWEYNHFEHCGREWPHPQGKRCKWPLPVELGGDTSAFRPYDDEGSTPGSGDVSS